VAPPLLDTLQAHGIYPIARIVVFKDRMLAEKKPELAIRHANGGVWKDQKGKPWVNPYDRRVWDYNVAIAREALDMGFAEVQWDYVRFPDVVESLRRTMAFPGANGKSRAGQHPRLHRYSKQQLASYRVPVTADVFGLATHMEDDVGIGQNWETVITAADAVLPMVYPSHYYAGMYGFQHPNAHPYEMVRISMQDAVESDEARGGPGAEDGRGGPLAAGLHRRLPARRPHLRPRPAARPDPGRVRRGAEELGAVEPRLQLPGLLSRPALQGRLAVAAGARRLAAAALGGAAPPHEHRDPRPRSRPARRRPSARFRPPRLVEGDGRYGRRHAVRSQAGHEVRSGMEDSRMPGQA
jgi:hypothetical protein